MGSVLGGVTDAFGLTDYNGQDKAQQSADKQAERSYNFTREELDFQREQYDEWKSIYGPLQEDLGTYYKNLTGDALADSIVSRYVTEVQIESQRVAQQNRVDLAQRGMSNSGLGASLQNQNLFQAGMAKADVRATAQQKADDIVEQKKLGFLGVGLGQGTQMLGTQANIANTGASTSSSLSGQYLNQATTIGKSNTAATTDLAGTVGGYASGKGWI